MNGKKAKRLRREALSGGFEETNYQSAKRPPSDMVVAIRMKAMREGFIEDTSDIGAPSIQTRVDPLSTRYYYQKLKEKK